MYGCVLMFFINREHFKNSNKPTFLKVLSLANDILHPGVQMSLEFLEKYELVSRQTGLEIKYINNMEKKL